MKHNSEESSRFWILNGSFSSNSNIYMKQGRLKLLQEMQELLLEQNGIQGQITHIENQINELETLYLQRTWCDGNVYLGWNRSQTQTAPSPSNVKITIDAKEKIFSLSSLSSPAFSQLGTNVDRQLAPYGQQRFQSKNKKSKKKKSCPMHKSRSIRKRRRR